MICLQTTGPRFERKMAINSKQRWNPFRVRDKARVFWAGLRFAVTGDRSVATQLILSLVVLIIAFWLRTWVDLLLILIVTGHMLALEIVNTVIEALCDYVQPEHNDRIGRIKDMSAAASGISIVVWVITMLYEVMRMGFLLWA